MIQKPVSNELQVANLAAADVVLDGSDMDALAALDRGERRIDPDLAPHRG